jgi:hypothetical protein
MRKKRLNAYVIEKMKGDSAFPGSSVFDLSEEGSLVSTFYSSFERLSIILNPLAGSILDSGGKVRIYVPATETGIEPMSKSEQPFGWNGKINEHSAELAVWWAFEIMTETEASEFLRKNRPIVVFEYMENGGFFRLKVKYEISEWIVLEDDHA